LKRFPSPPSHAELEPKQKEKKNLPRIPFPTTVLLNHKTKTKPKIPATTKPAPKNKNLQSKKIFHRQQRKQKRHSELIFFDRGGKFFP